MITITGLRKFVVTTIREMTHSLRASPVFAFAVLLTLGLAGLNGVMILIMQLQPGFLGMAHFSEAHHRVHDLTFGFIFVPGVVGILAQLWRPSKNVAGMLMALVPWVGLVLTLVLTLALAGNTRVLGLQWVGVAASTLIATALHPTWRGFFRSFSVSRINRAMLGLVAIAAVPLLAFASANIGLQGTVRDDHALMGHYGFMAAFAFTVIGVGLVASLRPDGWRLTAWVAGLLPALLGLTSLAYPDVLSSLGQVWALAAIAWGAVFVAVAELTKGATSKVDTGVRPGRAWTTSTPRWVNVMGGIALVVILGFFVILFIGGGPTGGGGHGPGQAGSGQHGPSGSDAEATEDGSGAGPPPACRAQQFEHAGGGSGAELTCEDAEGTGEIAQGWPCQDPRQGGLQLEWDLDAGNVTVTIWDAAGATVFTETYSGQGSDTASYPEGRAGSWEVEAERGVGFAGSFTLQTFCRFGDG